jgi:hypothetical protein
MEIMEKQNGFVPVNAQEFNEVINTSNKDLSSISEKNNDKSLNNGFDTFITPKFVAKTIRNLGYNNYQAISDIIDNSLENNVNSSFVKIEVVDNKGDKLNPYKSISIIDNGSGMNKVTLVESIKLGSETGKNNEDDLGCYGQGLKGASFSLGKRFEIYTKTKNDSFYYAKYDLDELVEIGWGAPMWREGTREEYTLFKSKTNSDYGTVIVISKIDKTTNKNIDQFTSILKKELGTTFYYQITEFKKKLFVNNDEVIPIDPMYRHKDFVKCLSSNETINYDDKEFKFSVFEIESVESITNNLEYPRNNKHQGIWIYRNLRLVGKALDLGILNTQGDNYLTGFRVELHISGDADSLFSSTATKIITEKGAEYIDQGLHNKLSDKLKPYVLQVKRERKKKTNEEVTPEILRDFDGMYQTIGKNKFLDLPKHGKNNKIETCEKCGNQKSECTCVKSVKPETNPDKEKKTRQRKEIPIKYDIRPMGQFNVFFDFEIDKAGRTVVVYNSEHPAWEKMISLDSEGKFFFTEFLVSMVWAKKEMGYYHDGNDEMVKNVDFFIEQISEGLRRNVLYN